MTVLFNTIRTPKSLPQVLFIIKQVFGSKRTVQVIQKQNIQYLFTKIHENFMAKSTGGPDEFGSTWKPLAPSTIARKLHNTLPRPNSLRASLTAAQDLRWRGIYRSQLQRGRSPAEAGRLAWGLLRKQGARTAIERTRGKKVPINIETHRLERSLRPSKANLYKYRPYNADQQVDYRGEGSVQLGTKVPYAKYVERVRPITYDSRILQNWVATGTLQAIPVLQKILQQKLS